MSTWRLYDLSCGKEVKITNKYCITLMRGSAWELLCISFFSSGGLLFLAIPVSVLASGNPLCVLWFDLTSLWHSASQ